MDNKRTIKIQQKDNKNTTKIQQKYNKNTTKIQQKKIIRNIRIIFFLIVIKYYILLALECNQYSYGLLIVKLILISLVIVSKTNVPKESALQLVLLIVSISEY